DFRPTFYNPFEIKHRRRTSRAQLKILEKSFSENSKPNATTRRILAQTLDMTPRGVQIWFQNRRAKAKLQRRGYKEEDHQTNNVIDSIRTVATMAAAKAAGTTSMPNFDSDLISSKNSGDNWRNGVHPLQSKPFTESDQYFDLSMRRKSCP
ncbi:homeobox-domain-containing protein, partial [Backusella circina FSU 941]